MSECMPNGAEPGRVHDTDQCVDPGCRVETPHGHHCPCCGPGTYLLPVPDADQSTAEPSGAGRNGYRLSTDTIPEP